VFASPRRSPDAAGLTSCRLWLQNRGGSKSSAGAGVPGRSREQRLRALAQANEVRTARAELKRELASGTIELVEVLADPPPWARTARVRDLLVVLPRIGSVRPHPRPLWDRSFEDARGSDRSATGRADQPLPQLSRQR
jgi:hypothetical protein